MRHNGASSTWVVIAQGDLRPPTYRSFNRITGAEGPLRTTYGLAQEDAEASNKREQADVRVAARMAASTESSSVAQAVVAVVVALSFLFPADVFADHGGRHGKQCTTQPLCIR